MKPESISMMRSLKGPGLSVFIALMISQNGLINKELVTVTGYSKDKVAEGLGLLKTFGLVDRPGGRYGKWILTSNARQLVLPIESSPRISSSISNGSPRISSSRDDSCLLSSSNVPTVPMERKKESKYNKSSPRISSSISPDNKKVLDALMNEGVFKTKKAIELSKRDYVTAEYVKAQAERLRKEKRFSPGLLLTVIEAHDPEPEIELTDYKRQQKELQRCRENGVLFQGYICPFCMSSNCTCGRF